MFSTMWNQFWNVFYAVVYAAASLGLAYCCVVCLTLLGGVPASAKAMYLLLVGLGAWAAVLTGESAVTLFRDAFGKRSSESSEKKPDEKADGN